MSQFDRAILRRRLHGVIGIAVIAALVAMSYAVYSGSFTSTVPIVVESDRAGLLLDKGSDVRVDGLPVGTVQSIQPTDGGVEISVALDPEQARSIGTAPTATIEATTTFGAKYVALRDWRRHGAASIRPWTRVRSAGVTTETNDVFEQVQQVTTVVSPSDLSAMLDGLARTLDSRGETLGELIATGDAYLAEFAPHQETLAADLQLAPSVLELYRKVAPDLLSTGANVAKTSRTLVDQQDELAATLDGIAQASAAGDQLVAAIAVPLASWLRVLRPVIEDVLARYAGGLPCLLKGIDRHQRDVNNALGVAQPGYQGVLSFLPGQRGYKHPRDLPKIIPPGPVDCRSLPEMTVDKPKRHHFDDGTHVFDDSTGLDFNPLPTLYEDLFGEILAVP